MSEFLRVQFVTIFHLLRSSTCAFTESLLLSLETDRRKNLDISFFFFFCNVDFLFLQFLLSDHSKGN